MKESFTFFQFRRMNALRLRHPLPNYVTQGASLFELWAFYFYINIIHFRMNKQFGAL